MVTLPAEAWLQPPRLLLAAVGARADALMLNKGPNRTATVQTLRSILEGMETVLPEHRRHLDQWRSCLAFSPLP